LVSGATSDIPVRMSKLIAVVLVGLGCWGCDDGAKGTSGSASASASAKPAEDTKMMSCLITDEKGAPTQCFEELGTPADKLIREPQCQEFEGAKKTFREEACPREKSIGECQKNAATGRTELGYGNDSSLETRCAEGKHTFKRGK
jgi:hypothetical protein